MERDAVKRVWQTIDSTHGVESDNEKSKNAINIRQKVENKNSIGACVSYDEHRIVVTSKTSKKKITSESIDDNITPDNHVKKNRLFYRRNGAIWTDMYHVPKHRVKFIETKVKRKLAKQYTKYSKRLDTKLENVKDYQIREKMMKIKNQKEAFELQRLNQNRTRGGSAHSDRFVKTNRSGMSEQHTTEIKDWLYYNGTGYKWEDLRRTPPDRLHLVVRPSMLNADKKALENFQTRLQEDLKSENEAKQKLQERADAIREKFKERTITSSNNKREKQRDTKVNTSRSSTLSQRDDKPQNNCSNENDNGIAAGGASRITELAKPKQRYTQSQEDMILSSECKGLYMRDQALVKTLYKKILRLQPEEQQERSSFQYSSSSSSGGGGGGRGVYGSVSTTTTPARSIYRTKTPNSSRGKGRITGSSRNSGKYTRPKTAPIVRPKLVNQSTKNSVRLKTSKRLATNMINTDNNNNNSSPMSFTSRSVQRKHLQETQESLFQARGHPRYKSPIEVNNLIRIPDSEYMKMNKINSYNEMKQSRKDLNTFDKKLRSRNGLNQVAWKDSTCY